MTWFSALWCRLAGRGCPPEDKPKTSQIISDMKAHAQHTAEATEEIRRRRGKLIDGVFFPGDNHEGHRNAANGH
jgi:hypothetical protein